MLASGHSPAAGRESVDPEGRALEQIMLQVRLAEGIPEDLAGADGLVARGLLENADGARLRLTLKGRMLADAVVRILAGWD
jgi:oxygen-independent coproporphyrinogen-3 oxidase